ncbi:non-ribosomal peptide synthetase [Silvibacterium acidisoli]|uniref:non-ribosomal peptide synthetase n=1 Tax=Acidobacteriaceae bacterium ZG23-2 TaxID=2883246 RepID=UPI00406C21D8
MLQQLPFVATTALRQNSEASLLLTLDEVSVLRAAAERMGTSLDLYLAGCFSALLSRLLWHESVSIIRIGVSPEVLTCVWDSTTPFRSAYASMRTELLEASSQIADAGPSFLFLPESKTFQPSSSASLRLTAGAGPAGSLQLWLTSAAGRWSSDILVGWLDSLRCLWLASAATPELPLRQLPLLSQNDLAALYTGLNQSSVAFPSIQEGISAWQAIARQAAATPSAIAVRHDGRQLTYAEIEDLSNLRARQLISLGAGKDRPVAICMERSELLPVALLSILKSGSCYVPLDPHHPRQRLTSILEECKPVAVLSDTHHASSFDGVVSCPVLQMDTACPEISPEPVLASPAPDDLAYIIYTSGTTGKPKGVQISQVSLLNLLETIRQKPGLSPRDRWLAVATISFDIATMDMLLPLFTGATLVISSRNAGGDPYEMAALIEQEDVTAMQATPFTLKLLANSDWQGKQGLKVIAGGEALPRDLANQLIDLGCELWNCYGPTETTIYSSVIRIHPGNGIVPIGGPVANTNLYVMDDAGRLVPPGVPGELYIGGIGVSHGYLDRPELTAQRFVSDPLSTDPAALCFRTGDLVRYLSTEEMQYMGRLDHQVKLRGFRIELGEIESVLRTHPIVADAAVILREDTPGEPRLIAYFTEDPSSVSGVKADLRAYASRLLPEYMLPSRVIRLDKMPLTGSGKVDRRALPVPEMMEGEDYGAPRPVAAGVEPASPLEAQLLLVFREVLNNNAIGVTDSFFDYGGYSVLTARLFSRIHRTLGRKLPISMLFDGPTPRKLAALIEKGMTPSIIVPIRTEGAAAPLFIVHSYLIYAVLLESIEPDRPIYGIRELEDAQIGIPLEDRARLYCAEIEKTCPSGPVHLAGWCAAGSLTVEVAKYLREHGRTVTTVSLFDAERPGWQPDVRAGESLLTARIRSSRNFHRERMRGLSLRGKISYMYAQWSRRWEDAVERFATRHRVVFTWIQERMPFLLPEALRYGSAGVAPNELMPTKTQRYPGEIVLFRASDVAQIDGADPSLGWDSVASQGVRIEFAPGDHESMFRPPHLATFGSILRRVLSEGEAALSA